jgi:hypothetical protein
MSVKRRISPINAIKKLQKVIGRFRVSGFRFRVVRLSFDVSHFTSHTLPLCHVLKKVDTITTITFFFFLLLFFLFTIHIVNVDYYKFI